MELHSRLLYPLIALIFIAEHLIATGLATVKKSLQLGWSLELFESHDGSHLPIMVAVSAFLGSFHIGQGFYLAHTHGYG